MHLAVITIICESQDPALLLCNPECQNEGVCELVAGLGDNETETGSCACPQGTSGDFCETIIIPAVDAPSCPPGTSGESCQESSTSSSEAPTIIDQATEAPSSNDSSSLPSCDLICQNGGRCELVDGSSTETQCLCDPGFSGDLCETADVPPAATDPPLSDPLKESTCDLDCRNGSVCGPSDGNEGGEVKCICAPGTSGDLCERVDGVTCGVDTCYYGSQCIQASDGGLYCDCTTINEPGKHFAGPFCQYEATTYCGDSEDYFCVNGGTCRKEGNGAFSCECPDEWSGPSCEFESQNRDHEHTKNCKLNCLNGGQCRKGAKDMPAIDGLSEGTEHLASAHSEKYEHCVCPENFAGMQCEHRYEECGNGEHMCLHGTKCVPPNDESHPKWTCECDETSGKVCQRHRSSVCTSSDADSTMYRGMTSMIYCVNDGVCMSYKQDGKSYPACKCPPQYTGPHCELLKTVAQLSGSKIVAPEKESAASVFGLFVSCLLLVMLALFAHTKLRGQTSRDKTAQIQAAHIEDEASKAPMMEDVDFEGLMEDVELL